MSDWIEPQDFLIKVAEEALRWGDFDSKSLKAESVLRYGRTNPRFADLMVQVIHGIYLSSDFNGASPPRDGKTGQPLVHILEVPTPCDEPVFDEATWALLKQVVLERQNHWKLSSVGLEPTQSLFFTGNSGVGKTLAAQWLAAQLGKPLITLNLATVVGASPERAVVNLIGAFDFAKTYDCVFVVDNLDAIASLRNRVGEVGASSPAAGLLTNEIDRWDCGGLLVATTNQPDFVDQAISGRFETTVRFPMPDFSSLESYLNLKLKGLAHPVWPMVLGEALLGFSYSEAAATLRQAFRSTALAGGDFDTGLLQASKNLVRSLDRVKRQNFAIALTLSRLMSQRQASEAFGVGRDTIRKQIQACLAEVREPLAQTPHHFSWTDAQTPAISREGNHLADPGFRWLDEAGAVVQKTGDAWDRRRLGLNKIPEESG